MFTVRTTPIVKILLVASIGLYLLQMVSDSFFGTHIFEWLGLVPYRVFNHFAFWQIFTYQFMHADLFHILFNMLVLWMIGSELEGIWGSKFFTQYYFLCSTFGGVLYLFTQIIMKDPLASMVPVVGASGGIYGLLVAYGILFSERVMLFMMIFPMKAKHFVLILAAVELFSTVFGARGGVANIAHLGGMIAGFGFLAIRTQWRLRSKNKNSSSSARKKRLKKSHLKLVINNDLLKDFDTNDDHDGNYDSGQPISH